MLFELLLFEAVIHSAAVDVLNDIYDDSSFVDIYLFVIRLIYEPNASKHERARTNMNEHRRTLTVQ